MRTALLALYLCFAPVAAHAASAGILFSDPEIFGVWGSVYPDEHLSLDGRVTLSTVDIGVTGHLPMLREASPHSLLLVGMAGWQHNFVREASLACDSAKFMFGAGYGYLGAWDLRLIGGATGCHVGSSWHRGYTVIGMVGSSF